MVNCGVLFFRFFEVYWVLFDVGEGSEFRKGVKIVFEVVEGL